MSTLTETTVDYNNNNNNAMVIEPELPKITVVIGYMGESEEEKEEIQIIDGKDEIVMVPATVERCRHETTLDKVLCFGSIRSMVNDLDSVDLSTMKRPLREDKTENTDPVFVQFGNIKKKAMESCLAYAEHYKGSPPKVAEYRQNPHNFREYDQQLMESLTFTQLCHFGEAALFLECEPLHVVVCKYIGFLLRKKSKEEMLKTLGRDKDFTEQEYEEAMKHPLNVIHPLSKYYKNTENTETAEGSEPNAHKKHKEDNDDDDDDEDDDDDDDNEDDDDDDDQPPGLVENDNVENDDDDDQLPELDPVD